MTVFIADKLPQEAIVQLERLGVEIVNQPGVKEEDLNRGVGEAMVLLVRSTVVSRKCILNSPSLTLIVRAGAGVNNIDMEAASDMGIYVANCPGMNSIAVAELTLGLILSLDRFLPDNVSDFRNGIWNKAEYSRAEGLFGKVLGIIGVGQIGLEVIRRAKAFGMPVIAWSRSLTEQTAAELGIAIARDVEEVASKCDVMSVHLALKPETRGVISKRVLEQLKDGALFVNTSRAETVDEDALFELVKSGRIRAALDVFNDEPEYKQGEIKNRFQKLEGAYISHHIGASTRQAQLAVAAGAVNIVRGYLREGKVQNWLNRCDHSESPWKLIVRHHDKPGVIANVMNDIKDADINAQELENVIFDGKKTACCTIQLDAEPAKQVLDSIRSRKDEVISAVLIPSAG
jgi:D-3-phosphoglycerate dehydrogenase / 2-oxoglutarate reductase